MATDRPLEDDVAARKRAAACAAVAEIEDGMLVGLGTGTTANFAIVALGERVAAGLKVTTVATSLAAARAAEAAGLQVLPFDTLARLDLAIDGADELDPQLRAIKGKGGAMLREKIVAAAATRMIVVVDAGKQVTRLGPPRFQSRYCRSRRVSFLIASSIWGRASACEWRAVPATEPIRTISFSTAGSARSMIRKPWPPPCRRFPACSGTDCSSMRSTSLMSAEATGSSRLTRGAS